MRDKLQLPNVTLAAMTSVNIRQTVKALKYSMRDIDFGEVILVSHKKPWYLPADINYKYIDKIDSIDKFNYAMIYEMYKYIDTEFMLLVHADGFVVNPDMWRDEFLEYDYIGSPWTLPKDDFSYRDINGNICRVGNSVSIRSKRILEFPQKAGLPWEADHGYYNEDGFLCCKNKHIIEANGMKIAPFELAKYFGHERMMPELEGIRPFVFHKWAGTNSEYPKFK